MTSYNHQTSTHSYPHGTHQQIYSQAIGQNSLHPQYANQRGYTPPHQYQTMGIQAKEQNKLDSEEFLINQKIKCLDDNLQGGGLKCYTLLLYLGIGLSACGTLVIMLQNDSILNAIFVPICCFLILTFIILLLAIRGKSVSKANIALTLLFIQILGLVLIFASSYLQTIKVDCSGFSCFGPFMVMLFSAGGLFISLIYLIGAIKVRRILVEREELEKEMEAKKFDQEYL